MTTIRVSDLFVLRLVFQTKMSVYTLQGEVQKTWCPDDLITSQIKS